MIVTSAAAAMTRVFVSASGRKSRPVSPANANTGKKLSAVISSETRIAGASVPAAATSAPRRSAAEASFGILSSRRCDASSATTSASTAIPSAMPIPPRLMIVAAIPKSRMPMNVKRSTTGKVSSGTSALRPISKNAKITSATTPISSHSARSKVWSTRLASSKRS